MEQNEIPMVAGRKPSLPRIYGDTPSFLGCPIIHSTSDVKKYDVAVMGVPWEGTITWGSYSGCELAPKAIRHASARYGGYLPEYGLNFFDYIRVGDFGDTAIEPSSPRLTMGRIKRKAKKIYQGGAIPFSIGGDHSFTPEIVRALSECRPGNIGIIHFDAHLDNSDGFGGDKYPRCGPLFRISQIPEVKNTSIVHLGIRGPRNSPSQAEYARRIGATVYTINDIHKLGMEEVMNRAMAIAYSGTDAVYVTVCSDAVEVAYNPGGPADFDGLTPHQLFYALHHLGKEGIAGLDFVETYPLQDSNGVSSHLVSWAFIHALVGIASKKKDAMSIQLFPPKEETSPIKINA